MTEPAPPEPVLPESPAGRLFRIRSHHGDWLVRGPDGALALSHEPHHPAIGVLLLLDGRRAAIASIGPAPSAVTAVDVSPPDPGGRRSIALDTGERMTATPHGAIEAGHGPIDGWELFELAPYAGDVPAALLPLLEPGLFGTGPDDPADPAAMERFCAGAGADATPELQASLAAVVIGAMPRAELRRSIPALRRHPDYASLYPAIQARLSDGQRRSEWHSRAHLAAHLDRPGWSIGDHTYGAPEIIDAEYGSLRIGRYCSIAGGVRIVVANHATRALTTYPFAALRRFWPSAGDEMIDHVGRGVVVGNAVWIGAGVCLLPGARIGDGAIVGAHTVVASEIPAYAVAVGNPARIVRLQHDRDVIDRLVGIAWWDWPDHEVDRAIPILLADDPAALIGYAERRIRS